MVMKKAIITITTTILVLLLALTTTSAVKEDEEIIVTGPILAIVGLVITVAGKSSEAVGEISKGGSNDRIQMAVRDLEWGVRRWNEIWTALKRDYDRLAQTASPDSVKRLQHILKEKKVELDALASAGHPRNNQHDNAGGLLHHEVTHTLVEKVFDLSATVIGAADEAAGAVIEPVTGTVLSVISATLAIRSYALDSERAHGEANSLQIAALLARDRTNLELRSCLGVSKLMDSLESHANPKKNKDVKLREFSIHMRTELQKVWQCQCAQFANPEYKKPNVQEMLGDVTLHFGGSYENRKMELNPSEIGRNDKRIAKEDMSVRIEPVKRRGKKLPALTDIAVVTRPCVAYNTETEFEKKLKANGFTLATRRFHKGETSPTGAAKCHSEMYKHGDTNVGRGEDYEVNLVYVQRAKGRLPIYEVDVVYGPDANAKTNFFKIPVSTGVPAANWNSFWRGRMFGSYDNLMPFIAYRSDVPGIACPRRSAEWCMKRLVGRGQCVWEGYELRGVYTEGWKVGVKYGLAEDGDGCIRDNHGKTANLLWQEACREAYMKVTYQRVFGGSTFGRPENFPYPVQATSPDTIPRLEKAETERLARVTKNWGAVKNKGVKGLAAINTMKKKAHFTKTQKTKRQSYRDIIKANPKGSGTSSSSSSSTTTSGQVKKVLQNNGGRF